MATRTEELFEASLQKELDSPKEYPESSPRWLRTLVNAVAAIPVCSCAPDRLGVCASCVKVQTAADSIKAGVVAKVVRALGTAGAGAAAAAGAMYYFS